MKDRIKTRTVLLSLFVIPLLIYLFWGPLFPWSPIKIGYTKIESSKVVLYVKDISSRDRVLYKIENVIREEQRFHDLQYKDDLKIIVLDQDSNMKRFLPWLNGTGYSVSLSFINVIYMGPIARKSVYGIEPYLKHELSHMLIDQNTSAENALAIHEQGWLAEGVATYFGGPEFFTKEEFAQLCEAKKVDFSSLHANNPLKMAAGEIKFKYTFYKFFIAFLINSYGLEKFQSYLREYMVDPQNYKSLFHHVYSEPLDVILKNYKTDLYEID